MAIIKKYTNNKCWRQCGKKGTLLYCCWECKVVQSLWKTVWRFPKKLKLELPYDPAILFLGIYLEKTKTLIRKDTYTPVFIAALFTIAKPWKQLKCPLTDEQLKKVVYIYTIEYYSAIKMIEAMPFAATWMDLKIIILSEVSQRKTNIIWYRLNVESKK